MPNRRRLFCSDALLRNCNCNKFLENENFLAREASFVKGLLETPLFQLNNWIWLKPGLGAGGGKNTQQSFIRGGFAPMSNPLTCYIHDFVTDKVPLSYSFYWQIVPFHWPILELCNCIPLLTGSRSTLAWVAAGPRTRQNHLYATQASPHQLMRPSLNLLYQIKHVHVCMYVCTYGCKCIVF